MEKFRKKLIGRIALLGLIFLASAFLGLMDFLFTLEWSILSASYHLIILVQVVLLPGIWAAILSQIIRTAKALRDEKRLRLLYNEEHDERRILIRQKAGMPMLAVTSVLILIAGNLAGYYFSIYVFEALTATGLAQLFIGVGAKLYFTKTLSGKEETDGETSVRA